jgi:enediyne biosynthesis protein E9
MPAPQFTDVLVIGSGFGALPPALRMAEAGARVTIIEKGPPVSTSTFRQTQDPQYITRYLKGLSGEHLNLTYAEALGGGSGFYEMVSLRAPSMAFEQRDSAERRLWPSNLDRQSLDPFYELAERMLSVNQIGEDEVPKSGLVFSLLMKNLGYSCDRARYAVRNCLGSGFCVTGCIYGAKQSLHLNYLPQAAEAGAGVRCGLEAKVIRPIPPRTMASEAPGKLAHLPYRYLVECRDTEGESVTFAARLVVLGGGTVGTARLLMASRPFLIGLSPHVGRNIAFNGSVKVVGLLGDHLPDGDMFTGRSHPGMISYEFLPSRGITLSAVKGLPLQVMTAARLTLDGDGRTSWWGEGHLELLRKLRHRMLAVTSFGLTPPGGELRLLADSSLELICDGSGRLRRYVRETRELIESIFTRNGCRVVRTDWLDRSGEPHNGLFFSTAHQTGSARMADSAAHGVVSPDGQVFGYPGLYVSDGAAVPSSLAVNSSLTILANAERIAAGMVKRHVGSGAPALVANSR